MVLYSRRALSRAAFLCVLLLSTLYHSATAATKKGAAVVREALTYRGVWYRWGGTSRRGVDCSGLVLLVYRKFGIKLPRTARMQALRGTAVRFGRYLPGDLLFFRTRRGKNTHVGIYVGNNAVIHAPRTGKRVAVIALRALKLKVTAARRYF